MNRNQLAAGRQISLAQRRLQQSRIPAGASQGALAGLTHPVTQPPQGPPAVPQGADAGALAGCGDGGCASGYIPSPFQGIPPGALNNAPYLQPNALLGIFVQPATAQPTTLEISCGNTFFNGCGARSFTPSGTNLITSIVSGFDTRDQLCPGSGIDVAFFQTDDCYCPFDFGCFSNLAPLLLTFDPIDTQSVLAPLNMVIVGDRLEFGGCFPYPPGLVPVPSQLPAMAWAPGLPVTPAPMGNYMPPAIPPAVPPSGAFSGGMPVGAQAAQNPFYGSPWRRRMGYGIQ